MFSEFFEFLGRDIMALWTGVVKWVLDGIHSLADSITSFTKDHPIITAVVNSVTGGQLTGASMLGQGLANTADSTGAFVTGGGVRQGETTVHQNNPITIEVNGAGDPAAVAAKTATILGTTNQQNQNALGAMARP